MVEMNDIYRDEQVEMRDGMLLSTVDGRWTEDGSQG